MLKDLVFCDIAMELASTRRVLERLPDEHLDWRPHDRSATLGELASHVTTLVGWQSVVAREPELDVAAAPGVFQSPGSRAALLEAFDARARDLEDALAEMSEDTLQDDWTFRYGERVIFRRSRALALRTFGISHIVHHRAQLGVYLRLLNVPVPGVYGPSADEAAG